MSDSVAMNLEGSDHEPIGLDEDLTDEEPVQEVKEEPVDDTEILGLDEDEENTVIVYAMKHYHASRAPENETEDDAKVRMAADNERKQRYDRINAASSRIELNTDAAKLSNFFKTVIESSEDRGVLEEIPVPGVSEQILRFVTEYLTYHHGIPVPEDNCARPLKDNTFRANIKCQWDCDFLDRVMATNEEHKEDKNMVAKKRLYALVKISNFLDIQSLLLLSCARIACMMRNKSPDEVEKILDPSLPMTS
jgi:hypothetical protein